MALLFPQLRSGFRARLRRLGLALAFVMVGVAWNGTFSPSVQATSRDGFEKYSIRPDALTLVPKQHTLGADWQDFKRGHLEAIAMILEMYPDRELYFLARDSEFLYDLARWVTKAEPEVAKRLHLLNVSGQSKKSPHLKKYLEQEGISEEKLREGKKIQFIETGYKGSIPEEIAKQFPPIFRKQFQTQLLASQNRQHPSTRVFLTALSPAAPKLEPESMEGSILRYEHLPRFTYKSIVYMEMDGKWEPVGTPLGERDGIVSRERARQYMEDLLYEAEQPEARKHLADRRAWWGKIRKIVEQPDPETASAQLKEELRKLLRERPEDPFAEAMARDIVDLGETGHIPAKIPLADLGLEPAQLDFRTGSNKFYLIQKYPEWAPILYHPDEMIPKLIKAHEFGKLGAIAAVIQDYEFSMVLAKSLGEQPPSPAIVDFIGSLIEQGKPGMLEALASYTFLQPHSLELKDLIRELIEKGSPSTRNLLGIRMFRQPHATKMTDLLRLLIEESDPFTLLNLRTMVLSLPQWAKPEFRPYYEATWIPGAEQRAAFLLEKLGPPARKWSKKASSCPEQFKKLP